MALAGGSEPGAGFVLIAIGLIALVAISTVVAATRQVFAVALYRYAIDAPIGGFSAADLENPFTGGKASEKRKSWILRIGAPILALFFLLDDRRRPVRARPQDGRGGLLPRVPAAGEPGEPRPGAPVTAGWSPTPGRDRIGSVESVSPQGAEALVEFRIDPLYRRAVEHVHGFAVGPASRRWLCFGSAGACHAQPLSRPSG